jgi:putative membrane protein
MISHFLKGLAIGAANVIPGVSGGTIALVTGIYERLIHAVGGVDLSIIKLIFQGNIAEAWKKADGTFLVLVFAGVFVAILTIAKLFKYLLANEQYEILLMAFFFGLILVSIWSVGRTVAKWTAGPIIGALVGLAVAVAIALLTPASENSGFVYLMICGVVAMCSMILPGLSGSFVLLLMGNYKLIMVDAVSDRNLDILLPVALGAIVGLILFARLLDWVFKRFRDLTLATMTGFVAGSLLTIWPWKVKEYLLDGNGNEIVRKGKRVISGYDWQMPDMGEFYTWIAVVLMILGGLVVWLLEKSSGGK